MTTVYPDALYDNRADRSGQAISSPTGTSSLVTPKHSAPTPISALSVTANAKELVSKVRSLSNDISDTHSDALTHELSVRTQQQAKQSVQTMLSTLGDMGFSWRGVAKLLGVSVPAIQKWRRGDGVSGENRRKLATLIAGIDVIASQYTVQEIESWFETPVSDEAPVTPIDLWSAGDYLLVLQYASGQLAADSVLDSYEPEWREKWRSDFVAFRAEDGNVSIARKS